MADASTDFPVSLEGRRCFVTGASRGLGAYFAMCLGAAGARITVAARRVEDCERVCASISANGGQAFAVALDVTSSRSARAAVAASVTAYGGIDILVNNAGITATVPLIDQNEASWDRIIDTNLKGAFLVAQEVARTMANAEGGVIVNVASILGIRVAGQVGAYAASKAALVHLTKSMALELARHRIRVNALCPGYIETDLNRDFFASEAGQALIRRVPQRRIGTLSDLEGPLLFLCSDASAYMTGSSLVVDGGHLVSSL